MVKNPPANKRCGFDPWVGMILCRRKWQSTPVFLPGEIPWSSLAGYSPWGQKRVRPNLGTKQQYDIKTGALAQCKCIAGPHLPRVGSCKRHCKQGTEQNHTIPICFPPAAPRGHKCGLVSPQPPLGVTSAPAFPQPPLGVTRAAWFPPRRP